MIHTIVFFFYYLILLISGCLVAALLMAEKTNVGMAVFITDITYISLSCIECIHLSWCTTVRNKLFVIIIIIMCVFGSDGAAALLYACSFVRCCSHQFVFSCLEVLF